MNRDALTASLPAAVLLAAIGVGCRANSDTDSSGSAGMGASALSATGGGSGDSNTGGCAGDTCSNTCRSSAECLVAGTYCHPTGEPMCGPPCLSRRDCETDEDCGVEQVCGESQWEPCCGWWSEPFPTRCLPRCAPGDCGDDSQCIGGRCEAVLCSEEVECPPHTECLPGAPDADAHGCRRLDCERDADCTDGYCVNSSCYQALGACTVAAT